MDFRVLQDRHKGRPAVVLGAGPSLPGQLSMIPEGAVKIAVNERPSKLVDCDYIVFYDDNTVQLVRGLHGETVSPYGSSDYQVDDTAWFGGSSSHTAAYIACFMGCEPVILMGMDLYQGDREYFDDPLGRARRASGSSLPEIEHKEMWRHALWRCPNPQAIKAAGGPLVEIFGKYE